jgi:hypothetical protein
MSLYTFVYLKSDKLVRFMAQETQSTHGLGSGVFRWISCKRSVKRNLEQGKFEAFAHKEDRSYQRFPEKVAEPHTASTRIFQPFVSEKY